MKKTAEKIDALKALLAPMKSVLVAFSGGVDSAFLLAVAQEVLGDAARAVTAVSPTYSPHEVESARRMAAHLGVPLEILETDEFSDERFVANPKERCYWCKTELFGKLVRRAAELGCTAVLDGTNADDTGDYRPGMTAARELGVRSPLMEVGLTKAEIRSESRRMGLPTWDKPSYACLASRIPYGTRITPEIVARIEACECFLRDAGFSQVRVRHHGDLARIEVVPAEFARVMDPALRVRLVAAVKAQGYAYVTLDLQGYRTGSMNEVLDLEALIGDAARDGVGGRQ